jgi:hypothetical protein
MMHGTCNDCYQVRDVYSKQKIAKPWSILNCYGTLDRYVEEWLKAVCAAEYIEYNPADHTFYMTGMFQNLGRMD